MAEEENLQRHMVLYQADFNDLERQSKALTDDEKDDDGSKHQAALLPSSL